jgi:hypothetical protein
MEGFGFIKEGAKKAGKKMYGYGQQASKGADQFIEKHPVMAAGGILGGAYGLSKATGFDKSMGRQRVGEWLESEPELLQALKNEVGVMKVIERGPSEDMKSKGVSNLSMNPHRSNIITITNHLEKDPKKMQYLLESFKPEFREHIMSSIENHVNVIHKQAMERK